MHAENVQRRAAELCTALEANRGKPDAIAAWADQVDTVARQQLYSSRATLRSGLTSTLVINEARNVIAMMRERIGETPAVAGLVASIGNIVEPGEARSLIAQLRAAKALAISPRLGDMFAKTDEWPVG